MRSAQRLKSIFLTALSVFLGAVFVFPVIWLIISAFKPGNELFTYPLTFLPKHPSLVNFREVIETFDFLYYTWNTVLVTVTATVLTVILSATTGYALAKYRYWWIKGMRLCVLSMLMLSTEVVMSPSFEVLLRVGLYDNLWGIIIPTLCTPMGIFMMRASFMGISDSLVEAARIDGANEGQIFWRVMLPNVKSVIVILIIFSVRWRWNDYIWPLLAIVSPDKQTLQLAIANLVGSLNIEWGKLLAAAVLTMLALLLVFVIFQKRIMNSNISSGIK